MDCHLRLFIFRASAEITGISSLYTACFFFPSSSVGKVIFQRRVLHNLQRNRPSLRTESHTDKVSRHVAPSKHSMAPANVGKVLCTARSSFLKVPRTPDAVPGFLSGYASGRRIQGRWLLVFVLLSAIHRRESALVQVAALAYRHTIHFSFVHFTSSSPATLTMRCS
jgi:hypothetical protein